MLSTTLLAIRHKIELRYTRLAAVSVLVIVASVFLAACQPVSQKTSAEPTQVPSTEVTAEPNADAAGNVCPMVFDASVASFYPIQPDFNRHGWDVLAKTHLSSFTVLPGRHFLQVDCAPQVAALIAKNAAKA